MTTPLQYGDPPGLGPFVLRARIRVHPAGIVYLGVDPAGRWASIALLTRGAAGDAAARDRFAAAIRGEAAGWGTENRPGAIGGAQPPPVLAADPDGPAPWVAVGYDGARPEAADAGRYLAPVLVAGGETGGETGAGHRGPRFAPYWIQDDMPAHPPAPAPAPPASRAGERRALLGVAVVGIVAVIVAGGLGGLVQRWRTTAAQPRITVGPTILSPPPPSVPPPLPPPAGVPGPPGPVRGDAFAPGEPTYPQRLDGLGFSFRTPPDWQCIREPGVTAVVRWQCERPATANRVIIEVGPCRPCDAAAQRRLRAAVATQAAWRSTDATTAHAEWPEEAGTIYRLVMSHFWHRSGPSRLDSHVVVDARGEQSARRELQKIVNDIRARTP